MDSLFSSIDYWHWWILAGILLIIEVSAPSFSSSGWPSPPPLPDS